MNRSFVQGSFDDARVDAVVVGGGIAGLTAACYLARGGRSVILFERAAGLGGRAATLHAGGYAVNRGAHALYTGGAASAVLRDLGVTYRASVPKETFGLLDGRLFPLPTTPLSLLADRLLGWGDKLELMRLFATLPGTDAATLSKTTVQQWLDTTIRHPRLRRLMAAFARPFVYSSALDLVSADVFVDKLQRSLKHPIHYVDGGWQTLVDGLRRAALDAGVRIATGEHVETVLHHQEQVSGVRTRRGETVNASAVILATPPREAAALVDGGAYPGFHRLVESLVPATVACLDVALRTLPRPEHPVVMDLERPLFLTAQSRYARIAPEGAALIHTFKQLDPRRVTAAADDEGELEGLLDTVQPGWRAVLVRRYSLPRIEAVGALPLASSGGMSGRPGPRVPGLAQLFVAGDWVGAEGFLIDASTASARRVARLVLELELEPRSSGESISRSGRRARPDAMSRSRSGAPAAA